mgnify:FL=1|jgi:hypothetical protein
MPHPLLFYQNAWKHTTGEGVDGRDIYIQMTIPNEEIAYIYENHISLWFEKKIKGADLSPLMIALEQKDCKGQVHGKIQPGKRGRQAGEKNYQAEFEKQGYRDISVYCICFYRKECVVMAE